MGGRPDRLPLWRRDRFSGDHRTLRAATALGPDLGRITDLGSIGTIRHYKAGEKIIAAGDAATSLFFLRSGAVHVTLPDGVRLATLTAGMAFGEMALLESHRSADVTADMAATAYEIRCGIRALSQAAPACRRSLMRNLAQILADRLIVANTKVDLLTSS